MTGPQVFLMGFGALLSLIGVAVFFSLTWFKRGGEGNSAFKVLDKVELHVPHALVIFVAGVTLMALPFFVPALSAGQGAAPPPSQPSPVPAAATANRPPAVGDITLDSPNAVAGQIVRAQVSVSDPDRDPLDIRWQADVGRFVDRDSGASVTYQAPAAGASFQLTATVSDGSNPPVRVARNFIMASANPTATASPAPAPAATTAPAAIAPNLNGRWNHANGFVELQEIAPNQFVFSDFNIFGQLVGEGTAVREGDILGLAGRVIAFDLGYLGELQIVSNTLMKGTLVDFLGNSAYLVLSR